MPNHFSGGARRRDRRRDSRGDRSCSRDHHPRGQPAPRRSQACNKPVKRRSHGQPGVRGIGYFDYYNGIQHSSNGSENDVTVTNPTTGTPVTNTDGSDVTQPEPEQNGQAGSYGTSGDGWYSYNLGNWHLISLNIECADEPGGCSAGGSWIQSETNWLRQDLSQDQSQCTLAYWHQPTFSSTASPFTSDSLEGQTADAWWQLLYQHRATLILNGHDHVYSRFAPMDPAGKPDPRHGIREFIIGTGGESLDTVLPSTPNLQHGPTSTAER